MFALYHLIIYVVIFLGLILGMFLSKIAAEEMPEISKYIEAFTKLIVAIVFILATSYNNTLLIGALILAMILFNLPINIIKYIFYLQAAIIRFCMSEQLIIISILMFTAAILLGSVLLHNSRKDSKKNKHKIFILAIFQHSLFLLIAIISIIIGGVV